jgi:hypothetical protein
MMMLESIQRAQGPRLEMAKTRKDLQEAKRQLAAIDNHQHTSTNIKKWLTTSRAYTRLVDKVDKQEPQVKKVLSQQTSQQKGVDNFLTAISAE